MDEKYRVVLDRGRDGFVVATVPEVQGCVTQGADHGDAIRNLLECLAMSLDVDQIREEQLAIEGWTPLLPKVVHVSRAAECPDGVIWSGAAPLDTPPPVGARVNVVMNSFGLATVTGYFTRQGTFTAPDGVESERLYLALMVCPDVMPGWYIRQEQQAHGHVSHEIRVFGAEVCPDWRGRFAAALLLLEKQEIEAAAVEFKACWAAGEKNPALQADLDRMLKEAGDEALRVIRENQRRALELDRLTRTWTEFPDFTALLNAKGANDAPWRPLLMPSKGATAQAIDELRRLADAYDQAQERRGDPRRAARGDASDWQVRSPEPAPRRPRRRT